jgi:hypothetical protein
MWATQNRCSALFVLSVTNISIMATGDVPSSVVPCITSNFYVMKVKRQLLPVITFNYD